jgi:AcrR family transcriptional regulator
MSSDLDDTQALAAEPTSRRERKKADNRAALLVAARTVFAEMGFGAASVRDIVRRTDLATGTFYNYFDDKDAIFRAVVGELTGELLLRHQAGRGTARSAEEFVRRHFEVYFRFVVEDPELLALARRNFTAVRTLLDHPEVRILGKALHDDIVQAMERGILPRTDAMLLTACMAGIAFETSVVMVARDPPDPVGTAAFAAKLVLQGLRG